MSRINRDFAGKGKSNSYSDEIENIFIRDPFSSFYNFHGLSDVFLTCDVDWAPEYAIERVLNIVEKFGHKLTMIATHESKLLKDAPDWLEVGLHPDFTRREQEEWFDKKLLKLKDIYPNAIGMRSHRNFFGQNVGDLAKDVGLKYDASVFLWNEPFCQAHTDYNNITRFSYMWEDGIHLDVKPDLKFTDIHLHTPGLKILNVHPILMYLNSDSEAHRRSVTSRYRDLTKAPIQELSNEINKRDGIADLWIDLLEWLAENNIKTHCLRDAVKA